MKKDYFAPASLGKVLLIGLATAGTLTGCTTGNQMTRSDWGKCLGAIALGTGAGALVNGEKGAYVGAAAGIAACFVINAQSRRTRSAAQVESDYRSRYSQLPESAEVVHYQTSLPGNSVRRGEPLKIVSNVEAVSGRQQPIREVKEQIRIYEPGQSEPFKTAEKVASESAGSGAYENTFTVTFPSNMPQGRYSIQTDVFVNGERLDKGSNQIQVVYDGEHLMREFAAIAAR